MRRSALAKFLVVLAVALAIPPIAWAAGQPVTGTVTFTATFVETDNNGLNSNGLTQQINPGVLAYANGTASNQVDTLYAAKVTLAGAPTTINLTTLTDPAGNTANFARVREFIVYNPASTAGYDVKVEAGATNGWSALPPSTSPLTCRYLGTVRISDPTSTGTGNGNVVTSTSNTITLDPGANTVTIYILIAGGSAAFVPAFLLAFVPRLRRRAAAISRAA